MTKIDILSSKVLPNKKERHILFVSVEPGPKTKPVKKEDMADLQNTKKDLLFDINEVCVSNVKHSIIVRSNLTLNTQTTIGTFKLTEQVNQESKGKNMSRFIEQLEQANKQGFQVN